jgi:hypothetical protein
VHVFVEPQAFFLCSSPLASLLACYEHLLNKRECAYHADKFNSQPSVVMERHTKVPLNGIVQSGAVLTEPEKKGKIGQDQQAVEGEMNVLHTTFESLRTRTHMPHDTVTVVAPTDYAVHSLDRVLSPQEMLREELSFTRQVAISCGIPCAMLLQGGGSIGASATSASNTNAWAEGIEVSVASFSLFVFVALTRFVGGRARTGCFSTRAATSTRTCRSCSTTSTRKFTASTTGTPLPSTCPSCQRFPSSSSCWRTSQSLSTTTTAR